MKLHVGLPTNSSLYTTANTVSLSALETTCSSKTVAILIGPSNTCCLLSCTVQQLLAFTSNEAWYLSDQRSSLVKWNMVWSGLATDSWTLHSLSLIHPPWRIFTRLLSLTGLLKNMSNQLPKASICAASDCKAATAMIFVGAIWCLLS